MSTSRPGPKDAAFAREFIATMERDTKSRKARIAMAKGVLQLGNYTQEGKAVWADYLKRLEAGA